MAGKTTKDTNQWHLKKRKARQSHAAPPPNPRVKVIHQCIARAKKEIASFPEGRKFARVNVLNRTIAAFEQELKELEVQS